MVTAQLSNNVNKSCILCFAALVLLAACKREAENEQVPGQLLVIERVEHLDGLALREPMLVEHPAGPLFAAGYSRTQEEFTDPPNLYVSGDGGRSWAAVDVGTPEQGALGNSDVDLAIASDGTLYFLAMGFDRSVAEGTHIAVGVSRDVGRSWIWTYLSRDRFDDRPWIAIAPDGVAHVIWNDGAGVCHAISEDAGKTWIERARIHASGGSSHLAVGPNGELAVRIVPWSASGNRFDKGIDLMAISTDGGDNWQITPAPGERIWADPNSSSRDIVPRWVEPVAWAPDGMLFYLWSTGKELWLGRSKDLAATWDVQLLFSGEVTVYYPFLVANQAGELAASWFSGFGDELRANIGLIDEAGAVPVLRTTTPLTIDSWRVADGGKARGSAGEYFPVVFLADGDLAAVLPVQASERGDGFDWLRVSRIDPR